MILACSKSMIWINENVLRAYGNHLAQHFFHLKETQGEERFVVVREEGFSKRVIPHPGKKKKAVTTSLRSFPSRLFCIINTKISFRSVVTIRTACKGSLARAEHHPRQTQDVPRSPPRQVPGRAGTNFRLVITNSR